MATNTYVALETKTLTSAVSSVSFDVSTYTSYTDLQIIFNGGVSASSPNTSMRFNNDTGNNYGGTVYEGRQGGTANTVKFVSYNNMQMDYYGSPSTTQSMLIIDIFSFRKTGYYRTAMSKYGNTTDPTYSGVGYMQGVWMNTADPITSIQLFPGANNWNIGSTFTLYGIQKFSGESTPKATGGYVSSDSSYWYHSFINSGTFIPSQSLTADVLVIAGGGGGGTNWGGGGGAGGYTYYSAQSLTTTTYTCTVGAGGAGAVGSNTGTGSSGGNSSFTGLTASVGGGGGGSNDANGVTGGSGGGGGAYDGSSTRTGGGNTSGQGYAGGQSTGNGNLQGGGGGGGASAAGSNAATNTAGNGGVGISTYSSWGVATGIGQNVSGTYYLAGGGGGGGYAPFSVNSGTGGYGGGGVGGYLRVSRGASGLIGSGGGGGGTAGGGTSTPGGNGGSGVVIVRYAK